MSSSTEAREVVHEGATDAREQIAELRQKVEGLLAEKQQSLTRAVDRAEVYAGNVADKAQREFEDLQDRVRERPATSLLIAVAAGYVLARVLGR